MQNNTNKSEENTMNYFDIIVIVIGALDILAGLASIFTGRIYMMGSAGKYTEESLSRYARPLGFINLLTGAGLVCLKLLTGKIAFSESFQVQTGLVVLIGTAIIATVIAIAKKNVLVKKAN